MPHQSRFNLSVSVFAGVPELSLPGSPQKDDLEMEVCVWERWSVIGTWMSVIVHLEQALTVSGRFFTAWLGTAQLNYYSND